MLQAFSTAEKTGESADSKIPVEFFAGKDAVIDVEQVELSELSVSLKKRLSKTLAPLVQLYFYCEGMTKSVEYYTLGIHIRVLFFYCFFL